jgi:formate dehydrogenase subunit gamma
MARKHRLVDHVDTLDNIVARHGDRDGPLLPILHDVQAAFGHVSEDMIRAIAAALNLTRAEVHGAVSFYHDFRDAPADKPVIKLCQAEACQARGVAGLRVVADAQTRVNVEAIYCLGLCAAGPAAMVGEAIYARLDAVSFGALIEAQT